MAHETSAVIGNASSVYNDRGQRGNWAVAGSGIPHLCRCRWSIIENLEVASYDQLGEVPFFWNWERLYASVTS